MHKSIYYNIVMSLKKHIDETLDNLNEENAKDFFAMWRVIRALIRSSFRSEVMMDYPSELKVYISA